MKVHSPNKKIVQYALVKESFKNAQNAMLNSETVNHDILHSFGQGNGYRLDGYRVTGGGYIEHF